MPISHYLSFATNTSTFCYEIFQKWSYIQRLVLLRLESPHLDATAVNILKYLLSLFFLFLNNFEVSYIHNCTSAWTPKSKTFSFITKIISHIRKLTIIPQYLVHSPYSNFPSCSINIFYGFISLLNKDPVKVYTFAFGFCLFSLFYSQIVPPTFLASIDHPWWS